MGCDTEHGHVFSLAAEVVNDGAEIGTMRCACAVGVATVLCDCADQVLRLALDRGAGIYTIHIVPRPAPIRWARGEVMALYGVPEWAMERANYCRACRKPHRPTRRRPLRHWLLMPRHAMHYPARWWNGRERRSDV